MEEENTFGYNKDTDEMKHILFPTDFTKTSKNAIYYGLNLFGSEPCKYYILNIFDITYTELEYTVSLGEQAQNNAKRSFKSLIKQINKDFPNNTFEIETEFKFGELIDTVEGFIKKKNIDLVIMGTQGDVDPLEAFLGSVTSSIIKYASCTVLSIPGGSKFEAPDKIVLAIDNEMELSELVLHPLLDVAKKFKSKILLLHVNCDGKEKKELEKTVLDKYIKNVRHSYHTVYDKKVPFGIEKFMKEQNASMLAMVTNNLNPFQRLFHKSTTKKIALHSEVPLLAMHNKKL